MINFTGIIFGIIIFLKNILLYFKNKFMNNFCESIESHKIILL